MIKKKLVTVQKNLLTEVSGTPAELCDEFQNNLPKYTLHVMVLKEQFRQYYFIKETPSCTVIIDFSENFTSGRARSIQSAHFGGSNKQITLHTGVAYTNEATVSFCTVSDCTRHDAPAIWAHLQPIIHLLCNACISTIHFWSDGPSTQYKNRHNFCFFTRIPEFGLQGCTWNYFESSHGKEAADAIGGIVKRTADNAINRGVDITDSAALYKS